MIITTNGESVHLKQVSVWNFSGNSIGDDCWDDIVQIVHRSSRLKNINFDGNNFTYIPKDMFEALKKVGKKYFQLREGCIYDV